MIWKLAHAKEQFSKVVRLAQSEPQVLHNRDLAVAAVIGAKDLDSFRAWRKAQSEMTLMSAFAHVRALAKEEVWELAIPVRQDRANAWLANAIEETGPDTARKRAKPPAAKGR
jgi:hypothetical protein